ncbi:MAG: zinc ABC transporter substrate-binding protein [Clostridia bacterium]|nr:zinc ABC transporter substrate-binding protein [Clostridia bacterium]
MKTKKIISLLLALLLLTATICLPSCGGGSRLYSEGTGELNIVCTNFPPFDFSRVVGGDKVTVTILQDNGADLHSYAPTSNDIMTVKNADVLVCVGGVSDDSWLEGMLRSAANPSLKVFKFTEHAELLPTPETDSGHDHDEHEDADTEDDGHEHGESCEHDHAHDEHVWTSLKNAVSIVTALADVFAEADSANGDYYKANAESYVEKLNALDAQYVETVANSSKKTVIFADRFPFIYMPNQYGLEYHAAFSGCSTESNASFETTSRLIEAVNSRGASVILITDVSPENAPAVANTVASSTGAKIMSMNSCQAVTRSSIKDGITYLGIMTENLSVLAEALS